MNFNLMEFKHENVPPLTANWIRNDFIPFITADKFMVDEYGLRKNPFPLTFTKDQSTRIKNIISIPY